MDIEIMKALVDKKEPTVFVRYHFTHENKKRTRNFLIVKYPFP